MRVCACVRAGQGKGAHGAVRRRGHHVDDRLAVLAERRPVRKHEERVLAALSGAIGRLSGARHSALEFAYVGGDVCARHASACALQTIPMRLNV